MTYQAQIILNGRLILSRNGSSKNQLIAWLLTQFETESLRDASGTINSLNTHDLPQIYTACNAHFD